jgi:hypothetical protein
MKIYIWFIGLFISFQVIGLSQTKNTVTNNADSTNAVESDAAMKGDIYFSPVPVLGVNPAFGFIYGAGASTSWFMGNPVNTSLSSALTGIAYSTKKQLIITLKSAAYTDENNFILLGDWRYLNSSQPTFGIGTGPQSSKLSSSGFEYDENTFSESIETAQMMEFKFIRFYETVLKKVKDNFYLGIGYHLDHYSNVKDNLLNLDTIPPIITSYFAYNSEYDFNSESNTLSGISLNAIYDTRDNQNNPYKGRYGYASFKYNPTFLGSDKNSSTLWLEYREYFNFTPDNKNILGVWSFANLNTSGNLPYMDLPALGWDQFAKSGRGYIQGRFRGQNLWYGEVEFRKYIFNAFSLPIGMVAFINTTTASSKANNIDLFQYVEAGYGLGIRVMLSKKARTNLAIDYGFGSYSSSGFYIRLNETF